MLYFVIKIDLPSLKYFETKGGNFIYLHTFVAESRYYIINVTKLDIPSLVSLKFPILYNRIGELEIPFSSVITCILHCILLFIILII